jgi:hypothetical protein
VCGCELKRRERKGMGRATVCAAGEKGVKKRREKRRKERGVRIQEKAGEKKEEKRKEKGTRVVCGFQNKIMLSSSNKS